MANVYNQSIPSPLFSPVQSPRLSNADSGHRLSVDMPETPTKLLCTFFRHPRTSRQTLKPLPEFSIFSARHGESGPVAGRERSEKERLKEEEGKQEAGAEFTGRMALKVWQERNRPRGTGTVTISHHRISTATLSCLGITVCHIAIVAEGLVLIQYTGELVSTPSRLLKILLLLRPQNDPSSTATNKPLALLIHPRHPLSYMERLIQAEIPPLEKNGLIRPPNIAFWAYDPGASDDSKMIRWSAATEVGDFVRDASKQGIRHQNGGWREGQRHGPRVS